MAKRKPSKSRRRDSRKPSTALARRKPSTALVTRSTSALVPERRGLTDEITLGELGLVEVKLTPQEEMVLNEDVPVEAIQIKPTKHPTPFLSHPGYTRWFNRAFGRLGWAIAPASKPMKSNNSIVCPYVLYIHGKPAAFAMGEQDYFENNKDQSYGDALESTVASALRRCAKRMGVGLQLWDRKWLNWFIHEYCVCVTVTNREGKPVKQWRRKDDQPFYNETAWARRSAPPPDDDVVEGEVEPAPAPRRSTAARPAPAPAPPVAHHAQAGEPITQKQRQRMWVIIKHSGRGEQEIRAWLQQRFGLTSTKDVSRKDYDIVCTAIEAPGELPR